MSIILKENDWAEQMIASHSLGNRPSETLRCVARYYMDKKYTKPETRKKLDEFILQCAPSSSLPKWSGLLDYAVVKASKYHSVDIDSIDISDTELRRINSLEGKQIKRLAFTLLCLAKYHNLAAPGGGYWVNNKDNEIMALANIKTSIKRQGMMYWTLRETGMLQFSRKIDNTSVKVCFAEKGEYVLHITDFRNLGYQYLMYLGEPYFKCNNCGVVEKICNPEKGRNQKYCKACAADIAMRQRINSAIKCRNSENVEKNRGM